MNITINGHNLKVSETLEEYTRKKIDKLQRYLPNIMEVRVDISRLDTARGEDMTIAQITLRHQRGALLRAEEKIRSNDRDSVQLAINQAIDKMYRRIERFKGKRSRKGRGRFSEVYMATVEELDLAEDIPEMEDQAEELGLEYEFDEILRRKEIEVNPMTEDEAIEQMELLGHSFFMFYNATTGSVNVLYRRDSGGYGVLVPKLA